MSAWRSAASCHPDAQVERGVVEGAAQCRDGRTDAGGRVASWSGSVGGWVDLGSGWAGGWWNGFGVWLDEAMSRWVNGPEE